MIKNILNIFNIKIGFGKYERLPEDRVKAFVKHWYRQWLKASFKKSERFDFGYWGELVSVVEDAHFVKGRSSGTKKSFASVAEFNPAVEKIFQCNQQGDLAEIFTEVRRESSTSRYHVYSLRYDDKKGWLIFDICTLFRSPNDPVIGSDEQNDIVSLSKIDAAFMGRESHVDLNENILFQNDRKINVEGLGEGVTKLEILGKLNISSGVLGILDFGYDIDNFEPLQRRVKPGQYPVEIVTICDRVAGIRVKFEEELSVRWFAANTQSGNGVYGVDAGNLAIFDVEGLFGLSHLKKERIFNEWAVLDSGRVFSISGLNDCVITSSGFGDGAYPAFWGVNEQNEVVSLYIDFMVLVRKNEDGRYVSI